jgi:hypothetical protein
VSRMSESCCLPRVKQARPISFAVLRTETAHRAIRYKGGVANEPWRAQLDVAGVRAVSDAHAQRG